MNWLLKSNFFIAFCAFSQCIASFLLFGKITYSELLYAIAIFFGTKVVYTVLRREDIERALKEDAPFTIMAIISLLASRLITHHYLLMGMAIIITLLYGLHLFGKQVKQFSLRNSAWLKLIAIAVVWVLVTVVIPLNLQQHPLTKPAILFIISQLFFVFALSLPFDFSDAVRQEVLGFKTLPRVLGNKLALQLARLIIFCAWAFAGFAALPIFYVMCLCVLVYLKFLHSDLKQFSIKDFMLRFDGLLILQAILLCIASIYLSI